MQIAVGCDGLRVEVLVGGAAFAPLLDTGSAQTWLPASRGAAEHRGLRLAGQGDAMCEPTGANFSIRYADGTRVSGLQCVATLTLRGQRRRADRLSRQSSRLSWRQTIGAATSIVEPAKLAGGGASGAQSGVLALSPALESTLRHIFRALLRSGAPAALTLAARSRRMFLGSAFGGVPLSLGPTALDASRQCRQGAIASREASCGSTGDARANLPGCRAGRHATPIHWTPRHWTLDVPSAALAALAVPPEANWTEFLPLAAGLPCSAAVAQVDSGTTHIAAPHDARAVLSRAAHSPSSLALALGGGDGANRSVLVPLSHGCTEASSFTGCLRRSAAPLLRHSRGVRVWVLGLPFFLHHDVALRLPPASPPAGPATPLPATPLSPADEREDVPQLLLRASSPAARSLPIEPYRACPAAPSVRGALTKMERNGD